MMDQTLICPECKNGKHQNCDKQAYDDATDELVPCRCLCQK